MDKETEALADKCLRDAGYDPDLVRGRKTHVDIERKREERRRASWRIKNALKGEGEKQVGLVALGKKAEARPRRAGAV